MYEVTVTDRAHCRQLHRFRTLSAAIAFVRRRSCRWRSYTVAILQHPDRPYDPQSYRVMEEHGERHYSAYWR